MENINFWYLIQDGEVLREMVRNEMYRVMLPCQPYLTLTGLTDAYSIFLKPSLGLGLFSQLTLHYVRGHQSSCVVVALKLSSRKIPLNL